MIKWCNEALDHAFAALLGEPEIEAFGMHTGTRTCAPGIRAADTGSRSLSNSREQRAVASTALDRQIKTLGRSSGRLKADWRMREACEPLECHANRVGLGWL